MKTALNSRRIPHSRAQGFLFPFVFAAALAGCLTNPDQKVKLQVNVEANEVSKYDSIVVDVFSSLDTNGTRERIVIVLDPIPRNYTLTPKSSPSEKFVVISTYFKNGIAVHRLLKYLGSGSNVKAVVVDIFYEAILQAGTGGSVQSADGSLKFKRGVNVELLFKPDEGYALELATLNGASIIGKVFAGKYVTDSIVGPIKVIAQFRKLYANADLCSIVLDSKISYPLSSTTTEVIDTVALNVSTVKLLAKSCDDSATIKIGDSSASVGQSVADVQLAEGNNSVTIIVQAENGNRKSVVLHIYRPLSSVDIFYEAILQAGTGGSVQAADGSLKFKRGANVELFFKPDEGYALELATLNGISIIGKVFAGKYVTDSIVGPIKVIAQFRKLHANADLCSIVLDSKISYPLSSTTTEVIDTVALNVSTVKLLAKSCDDSATIKIGDSSANVGQSVADVQLAEGSNSIIIIVQAENATRKSLVLHLYRPLSYVGEWYGNTSQNKRIYFRVNSNNKVDTIFVEYSVVGDVCSTSGGLSTKTGNNQALFIQKDQVRYSVIANPVSYEITASFIQANSAVGSIDFTLYSVNPPNPICQGTAHTTYNAIRKQ